MKQQRILPFSPDSPSGLHGQSAAPCIYHRLCNIDSLGHLGPLFDFSDTWQLIINTGTTIITFLMVFLIQNTQNRDAEAMHVKLDELIRSNKTAHNALLDLEDLEEDELDLIRADYEQLAAQARGELKRGKPARPKREKPPKQTPET